MCLTKADEVLVILLDHSCRDVVLAAAGALMNLGADPACSKALTEPAATSTSASATSSSSFSSSTGCSKLVFLLRRGGLRDPAMASVACKALFNVLAAIVHRVKRSSSPKSTTTSSSSDNKKERQNKGRGGEAEKEEEEAAAVVRALEKGLGAGRNGLRLLHSSLDELLDALDDGDDNEAAAGFRMAAGALFKLVDGPLKRCEEEQHRQQAVRDQQQEQRGRKVGAGCGGGSGSSPYEELAPPSSASQEEKE